MRIYTCIQFACLWHKLGMQWQLLSPPFCTLSTWPSCVYWIEACTTFLLSADQAASCLCCHLPYHVCCSPFHVFSPPPPPCSCSVPLPLPPVLPPPPSAQLCIFAALSLYAVCKKRQKLDIFVQTGSAFACWFVRSKAISSGCMLTDASALLLTSRVEQSAC